MLDSNCVAFVRRNVGGCKQNRLYVNDSFLSVE